MSRRYILSINGSALDDRARLEKVREVYQDGDKILLNKFDEGLVREVFGDGYDVYNIPEGTHDTLHSALIIKSHIEYLEDPKEIILVTSEYHLRRCKIIFEKVFGREVEAVPAEVDVPSYFYVMEGLQSILARVALMYHPSKEEYERLLEVKSKLFNFARHFL